MSTAVNSSSSSTTSVASWPLQPSTDKTQFDSAFSKEDNIQDEDLKPGSRKFFDESPEGNQARKTYLTVFLGGTFMVILMIFTVLPIYWGPLIDDLQDFDGGFIGQSVSQALGSNQASQSRVTWTVISATNFPGGPQQLSDAVRNEEIWTAVAINPGSTSRLTAALTAPNISYNGAEVITAFAVEARNENAYRSLIRPSLQGTLDVISRTMAQRIAQNAANSTALASVMVASPQTIVSPVYYTIHNLIPFDQAVATASTFVGMLYQVIMGFFVVMIAQNAREASGYHKTLSTKSLIILRLSSSSFAYFMISLFYSLMNLAFQLDVTRKFGRGGFMVFWMVNYVGMLAVALALESLITLLTVRGIPFFMLLWIIANLSVSIFPLEVMPSIFKYGYAAPFYNLSKALRTVVFGTKNNVGQSVGILFAWVVISFITLPLIQCLGIWVARNQGKNTFGPSTLRVQEFGKTGRLDIIGFSDSGVVVSLNNGGGTFGPVQIVLYDLGYEQGWKLDKHLRLLGDVTGNGLPDIVAFGESHIYIAVNNGDGTFQPLKPVLNIS
ncbi:hypothetical protein H1R20_g15095, partial [Candolleomyces eurysporus]